MCFKSTKQTISKQTACWSAIVNIKIWTLMSEISKLVMHWVGEVWDVLSVFCTLNISISFNITCLSFCIKKNTYITLKWNAPFEQLNNLVLLSLLSLSAMSTYKVVLLVGLYAPSVSPRKPNKNRSKVVVFFPPEKYRKR